MLKTLTMIHLMAAENVESSGIGFVMVSTLFVTHDDFFLGYRATREYIYIALVATYIAPATP